MLLPLPRPFLSAFRDLKKPVNPEVQMKQNKKAVELYFIRQKPPSTKPN